MRLTHFVVAVLVAAPGPKDPPKKEPPTIVGEWLCESVVANGQPMVGAAAADLRIEFFKDGSYQFRNGRAVLREGKYAADSTKDPHEMEFSTGWGGKAIPGIFRVEKDGLTLCFADGGGSRPNGFVSAKGARDALMTFKRVEKKKD